VVTISLALATGGCGDDSSTTDAGAIADTGVRRDADTRRDGGGVTDGGGADGGGTDAGGSDGGGTDAGSTDGGPPPLPDSGMADAGGDCVPRAFEPPCMDYDCFCDPTLGFDRDPDCCTESGGFAACFEGMIACAVPGPFVPPAMV
jgi:hypothetical protein